MEKRKVDLILEMILEGERLEDVIKDLSKLSQKEPALKQRDINYFRSRLKTIKEQENKGFSTIEYSLTYRNKLRSDIIDYVTDALKKKKVRINYKKMGIRASGVVVFLALLLYAFRNERYIQLGEKPLPKITYGNPSNDTFTVVILRFNQKCAGYQDVGEAIREGLINLATNKKLKINPIYIDTLEASNLQENELKHILYKKNAEFILSGSYMTKDCTSSKRDEYCIKYMIDNYAFSDVNKVKEQVNRNGNTSEIPFRYEPGSIDSLTLGEFTGEINYIIDYIGGYVYYKNQNFKRATEIFKELYLKHSIKENSHWQIVLNASTQIYDRHENLNFFLGEIFAQANSANDTLLMATYRKFKGIYHFEMGEYKWSESEFKKEIALIENSSYKKSSHVLDAYFDLFNFYVELGERTLPPEYNHIKKEKKKLATELFFKFIDKYKNKEFDDINLQVDYLTGLKFFLQVVNLFISIEGYDIAKGYYESSCYYFIKHLTYKDFEGRDINVLLDYYRIGKNVYFHVNDTKRCLEYWKYYIDHLMKYNQLIKPFEYRRAFLTYAKYCILKGKYQRAIYALEVIENRNLQEDKKELFPEYILPFYRHLVYSNKKSLNFAQTIRCNNRIKEILAKNKFRQRTNYLIYELAMIDIMDDYIDAEAPFFKSSKKVLFKSEKEYVEWTKTVYIKS